MYVYIVISNVFNLNIYFFSSFSFSSVANSRPISMTSALSKVFERLVSVRLRRFMERSGVIPTTQFTYLKGLSTCDAILCVSHTLQSEFQSGEEANIVQINFSAGHSL